MGGFGSKNAAAPVAAPNQVVRPANVRVNAAIPRPPLPNSPPASPSLVPEASPQAPVQPGGGRRRRRQTKQKRTKTKSRRNRK